jgi:hypothetical protein
MPVDNKSYPQGVCPFTPNILIVINKKEIFILIKQLEIVLNWWPGTEGGLVTKLCQHGDFQS